ncbi:hypothetical protein [Pseudalkalibacillus berkeleyi]|uniref:Hydrolase n=1 Tax=Pseudalkalibacillus berkeleyi TaxID=1069813 RepID=A0ABS9GVI6_9BACL|nr:hypothetical protein [Pseudalkalibacillus berkeleyi]MCF6136828.1 hypothetical protein [Pseudalkalibacillus berkeleyi]
MSGTNCRFQQINDQSLLIHLPERPNGFAILLIGDVNHYVTPHTSSWIQHPERAHFVNELCSYGYTVIYSNLYGRHWGNDPSVEMLNRIYLTILKQEILNSKVHVLAEGMGALTALKWFEKYRGQVRSAAFMNPCLSLQAHGESVKEQKLFYKQFHREICRAYSLSEEEAEEFLLSDRGVHQYVSDVPVKIWHNMSGTPYSFIKHSRAYEWVREQLGAPISLTLQLTDTNKGFAKKVKAFYNLHEKDL